MIKLDKKFFSTLLLSLLVFTAVFLVACAEEEKKAKGTIDITLEDNAFFELNNNVLKNVAGQNADGETATITITFEGYRFLWVLPKKEGYTEGDSVVSTIEGALSQVQTDLDGSQPSVPLTQEQINEGVVDAFETTFGGLEHDDVLTVAAVPAVDDTSLAVPAIGYKCPITKDDTASLTVDCTVSGQTVVPFNADLDLPEITTTSQLLPGYAIGFEDAGVSRAAVIALGLTLDSGADEVASALNIYADNAQGFELAIAVDSVVTEAPDPNQ